MIEQGGPFFLSFVLTKQVKRMEENYSWKVGIKQNYYYFVNNMSDPSAVVDYLYSLRNPTILTDHMKEAIQVQSLETFRINV